MACPNVTDCPCKNLECERHSHCCQCCIFHRTRDYPPACLRKEPLPHELEAQEANT